MLSTSSVVSALSPVSGALNADGYDLAVSIEDPARLRVVISARPESCEECLVPRSLMEAMIASALQEAGLPPMDLSLQYPADGHAAAGH